MTESDIMYENGRYWVARDKSGYLVMQIGATLSTTLCTFKRDADGLSIAIASCDYRATHPVLSAEPVNSSSGDYSLQQSA